MKISYIYILIIFSAINLVTNTVFAQKQGQALIDSLIAELKLARDDTNKVTMLRRLSFKYSTINPNEGIKYAKVGLELAEKLSWEKGLAYCHNAMGTNYKAKADYSSAVEHYNKALKIFEHTNDIRGISVIVGNLGSLYQNIGEFAKALEYQKRALVIDEKRQDFANMAIGLGNIGECYRVTGEYSLALDYYNRSLTIDNKLGNNDGIARQNSNIGDVYYKMGKFAEAIPYLEKSAAMRKVLGNKFEYAIVYRKLGNTLLAMKDYGGAIKNLNEALKAATEAGNITEIMEANLGLYNYYKQTGSSEKALNYYLAANVAKDSIFNQKKLNDISKSEMTYNQEKKDLIEKNEQYKNDAIRNTEMEKQKRLRNSIIAGALIITLVSLFIFFFYKHKRDAELKRHDAEQKQKETDLNLQVSETEMKALRSQMNPHFIFNALQSIQTFLVSHKSEEANEYLLKFSKLMRLVLENSQYSEVPLKVDMQALELYMQLESIRLPHPFTYHFNIDESVNVENDNIPPLILQPFVENAIWHGLQYKPEPGHINISISKKGNVLFATVEDNGVGRSMSSQGAQPILHKKESLGMKLTEERLKILNELKNIKAQFTIIDLFTDENKPAGTKVELSLPLVS